MKSISIPHSKSQSESGDSGQPVILPRRVTSVDVYRGFVMFLMLAEVLSFHHVAQFHPGNFFFSFLSYNQEHVDWTGASLHDLIQPSFSFLVGVALPYSISVRKAKGKSFESLFVAALKRAVILIVLGILLRSLTYTRTNFTFEDTLTQIGMGYPFLFLLGFCSRKVQIYTLVSILLLYCLAFLLYPLPGDNFDYSAVGIPADWTYHKNGLAAHWNKNSNLAWAFDNWFLNLFPREEPFRFNYGGYATLNFIPTLGTMILGLVGGNILRSLGSNAEKIRRFLLIALLLFAISSVLHVTGISLIIKRIWTPAWVLFSGGCCFVILSFFHGIIEIAGKKKWTFFFLIIGSNSIAAYVLASFHSFVGRTLKTHFGPDYVFVFGQGYSSLVEGVLILSLQWLILLWMYRNKIFIKI